MSAREAILISTRIFNFSGQFSAINGITSLNISRGALIWGTASLGNAGWRDIFNGFPQNILGIISLVTDILANTEETSNNYVITSRRYKQLVDADLQSATHRLGAALAKCVVSRTIGVNWLQHVMPLIDQGIITRRQGSNERPDYVGLDKFGGWHSIEAKGRSNPPGQLINAAKQQATVIASIDGSAPVTSCGCVSHLYWSPIHIEFCDPTPNESRNRGITLIIDKDKYIQKYYEYFINLVNNKVESTSLEIETNLGNIEYMIPLITKDEDVATHNFKYGIYKGIYELIKFEKLSSYSVARATEFLEKIESKDQKSYLGPDGTLLLFEDTSFN